MAIGSNSITMDGFIGRVMAAVLPNSQSLHAPKVLSRNEFFLQNALVSLAFKYQILVVGGSQTISKGRGCVCQVGVLSASCRQ